MVDYITLQDIGKYDIGATYPSGTDERGYGSDGNEGAALNLHVDSIKLSWETMTNEEAQPAKKKSNSDTARFVLGEIDKVGILFPVWTVLGVFDVTQSTTDARDYGRLCHMIKTKGYKKLGVSNVDTAEIISYRDYGEREKDSQGTKTISFVNVRIKSCNFDQKTKPKGKLSFKLSLIETG